MPTPGDVVYVPFIGAAGMKPRPAVVVSSDLYHSCRSDIVVGVLTTQLGWATAPTDYLLQDWAAAGLNHSSAFRCYFMTCDVSEVIFQIGVLSARDWGEVQARLRLAIAV